MKKLIAAALLALLLTLPIHAGEAAFEGYLVQLTDEAPRLLSAEGGGDLLVVDTLEEARALPAEYVECIEPNYIVELFDGSGQDWAPSDRYYAEYQWSLQETGGLAPYRAGLTGRGVKVGFVDSGVFTGHQDLNAQAITGENFYKDGLAYSEDNYGHGTFSVGIVAACTDNGTGLAGIAPEASIYAYRVFSQKNTTMSYVVSAIRQAVADGCRVINLSLGTPNHSSILETAVEEALAAGAVVVAAVGNDGDATLQYPAAFEGVIGVGSVGPGLEVSSFSQRNETVFVTAPGEQIAGLGYTAADSYLLDLTSDRNQGTSYAAPVVTALAAVALGYDGDITAEGVRWLLAATAADRGDTGYDTAYGHGVVNGEAYISQLTRDFAIQYVLDGGLLPQDAPLTYRVTDEALTLPLPERENHRFLGWYADPGLTQPVTQIPAGSLGDVTVYAAWQRVSTLTGYAGGTVTYSAAQDGLLVAAGYDAAGRMTGLALAEAAPGEGTAALEPPGGSAAVRVFLVDRSTFRPLCQPVKEE